MRRWRLRDTKAWRRPATGLAFALFGLGGLVLSLVVFPFLWLAPIGVERRQSLARRLIAWTFRRFVDLLQWFGLVTLEFRNLDGLRADNQLLVANHPSLLDVVFLIAYAREANCVVKGSYWHNPFIMLVVRAANYLRNDRADLMDACVAVLQKGETLIIFPEGTRSQPGQPMRLLRGAANIALSSGFPFTPVVVSCHPPTLLKGQKWYDVPPRPARFQLRTLPCMPVDAYPVNGPEHSVSSRRALTRDLRQEFEGALEEIQS